MLRLAAVAVAAIAVSIVAMRNAAVSAFAEDRPALAAEAWPSHPRVVTQLALTEIGRATAERRPPSGAVLARMNAVLRRDPLAAEPFLVAGTDAFSAGRLRLAERLLEEAVRRDPRLPAARYLLADLHLRQGRTAAGLRHIAALIRRLPEAAAPLTPSLAAFAQQPGAADQVRAILNGNPQLRGNVLAALAEDPANAALVLDLAGREPGAGAAPEWQKRLIQTSIRAGEYDRAFRLWSRFSGIAPSSDPGLFNPGFRPSRALPPFNWTLAAGAAGVAEPARGGGLHVLFYGREEAVLAAQLMLLGPGRYRLRHQLRGGDSAPLAWAIGCLPGNNTLAEMPVTAQRELTFTIPPSCRAQELQLRGSVADPPAKVDLTIGGLELTRQGSQ